MQVAFGRIRCKTEPTGPGSRDGIQEVLKLSRFPRSIRFGWETEPTGLGVATVIFSKIDTYGAVRKPNLPELGGEDSVKNGELNGSEA